MTDNIVRKGGTGADRTQFGTHNRNDAQLPLDADTIPVEFQVAANLPRNRTPLPDLPEGFEQPGISFDYGDEDGRLYVYSQWKADSPDYACVTIWKDTDGDWGNSIWNGDEETGFDEDTDEEIIAYLQAVYGRIDTRLAQLNAIVLAESEDAIHASIFG
jgi:hypothetical protein